jgi:MYXO-CTERM domain-containing protein
MRHHFSFSRGLLMTSWLLAILTFVSVAFAEGRVHWAETRLKERDDHSWHLQMTIYMSRTPDVAEVPAHFEFEPTAYYERALVDGNKIIEHRVPLQSQQSIIADEDIGFLDPGSGKIQRRTRFSFKITRDHGFEAGEYEVKIRDGRSGRLIGSPVKLTLEGKNPVVDRRTMVFSGNIAKKPKPAAGGGEMQHVDKNGDVSSDTGSGAGGQGNAGPASSGQSAAGAPGAASSDNSANGEGAAGAGNGAGAEQVKKKPGGCGCRLADTRSTDPGLLFAPLGLALALALRRRRRAAR